MSTSRRKFLKAGTLVAVSTVLPLKVFAGASPSSVPATLLGDGKPRVDLGFSREAFSRCLNTQFSFSLGDEKFTATLVEVKDLTQNNRAAQNGKECFSLKFESTDGRTLRQNTYRTSHASLGQFPMFVVPLGRNRKTAVHEALFNHLF
jgi:hypothetical protein